MIEQEKQEKHEEFERICGGADRAFRLMRIYENCRNPVGGIFPLSESENREKHRENFTRKAEQEGYTRKQIVLFLNLQ